MISFLGAVLNVIAILAILIIVPKTATIIVKKPFGIVKPIGMRPIKTITIKH